VGQVPGSYQCMVSILKLILIRFLVGNAARIAIAMGLHTSSSERALVDLDPIQKEMRRRAFWSIYMMDRMVSTTTGRIVAIQDDDIDLEVNTRNLMISLSLVCSIQHRWMMTTLERALHRKLRSIYSILQFITYRVYLSLEF
jgi:Fungal specific transcription factor domain